VEFAEQTPWPSLSSVLSVFKSGSFSKHDDPNYWEHDGIVKIARAGREGNKKARIVINHDAGFEI